MPLVFVTTKFGVGEQLKNDEQCPIFIESLQFPLPTQ